MSTMRHLAFFQDFVQWYHKFEKTSTFIVHAQNFLEYTSLHNEHIDKNIFQSLEVPAKALEQCEAN